MPLAEGPLDGIDIEEAILPALPPHARRNIATLTSRMPPIDLTGRTRFRINLHRERGRAAAAVRMLPARVPRLPHWICRRRWNCWHSCRVAWC